VFENRVLRRIFGPKRDEVAKVRFLTDICGLRVKLETYNAPEEPLQFKLCERFGYTQRYCGYAPKCGACEETHSSGKSPLSSALSTVAAAESRKAKETKAPAAKRAQGERGRSEGKKVKQSRYAPWRRLGVEEV
jgi:hypothetical protein